MCVFAVAAKADITVYVQCETAPFIWWWGGDNGFAGPEGDWPGTYQLTETWTSPTTGDTFWKYTFSGVSTISFLFNNGDTADTKQTTNVPDITSDRYFELSWNADPIAEGDDAGKYEMIDVTEDYAEIPDVEIKSIGISGNHNGWEASENVFKTIGENKYQYSADVAALKAVIPAAAETEGGAETQVWEFKFRPNATGWLGYGDIYPGETAPAVDWLEMVGDKNFGIDLIDITESYITFTLTFAGGKVLTKGWTLEAEKSNTNGITNVASEAKAGVKYNLAGQRVSNNYRGIVIENGRKMMVK